MTNEMKEYKRMNAHVSTLIMNAKAYIIHHDDAEHVRNIACQYVAEISGFLDACELMGIETYYTPDEVVDTIEHCFRKTFPDAGWMI